MEKAPSNLELITRYFNDFTDRQVEQYASLEALYKDWNTKINVISRKDIDSLYEKHVLHSLSIATLDAFSDGQHVLDIGTGGGFPGIPLAIFYPTVKFHLVDSIGKKIRVVDEVVSALKLENVTTQHSRVEDIRNKKFDFVVSRAVAPLKDLWFWSGPLLKKAVSKPIGAALPTSQVSQPGLICLKGGDLKDEIRESGMRVKMMGVYDLFPLDFFKDKFIVYVR